MGWSCTFTTSPIEAGTNTSPATEREDRRKGGPPQGMRPWGVSSGQSPISGRGIGLPLSRIYAKNLGGSLEVINMPGLGLDAYLFLNRIDPNELSSHRKE